MAEKQAKKQTKKQVTEVPYTIQQSDPNDGRLYHSYNAVDAIYSVDKLYKCLSSEIESDMTRQQRKVSGDKSDTSEALIQQKADIEQKVAPSFRAIFCENSRAFYLLTMITRDCQEKGQDFSAFQVMNTFYECACHWQLVAARRSESGKEDSKCKTTGFLAARMHKGHITFDLANICAKLGWSWHRRYYLALTLAEDVLTHFFHVTDGSEFCRLLRHNRDRFRDFDKVEEKAERGKANGSKQRQIDLKYLKYLVSPPAEGLWDEPDQNYGMDNVSTVEKLERRIARFWRRTGLCQTLRTDFGLSLPDVMAWVVQIADRVFVKDSRKKLKRPLGEFHDVESSVWFADVRNWKRLGWGAAWLGFPEWLASQAGLFELLSSTISKDEVFSAPFNAAYYGYLCRSLMNPKAEESTNSTPDNLQMAEKGEDKNNSKGLLFEELCAYLCTATPGVRVLRNARSGAGELDMIGYVAPGSTLLHPVTGNNFLGECKWQARSTSVDVIDALAARAKRMKTDSVVVFSKNGLSGEGQGENAERVIHAEAMGGVSFAPLSAVELQVKTASEKFEECLNAAIKTPSEVKLTEIRGLVRFRFPKLLRDSFDKHRFGFYGSHRAEE